MGSTQSSPSEITENEVRAAFDQFVGALKSGDLKSLEEIYSDDYTLVRASGQKLKRQSILDDVKKHSMKFIAFEASDLEIKLVGSVGILTTEVRSAFVRDGAERKVHERQIAVFSKGGSKITVIHFQSTSIADT
jgi:ketosteroid isomerase-like protein